MKPSTATRVAEKTAPANDKPSSKVFDVARPGKTKPNASSRPIIVSNRPILQDPMVSSLAPSDVTPTESKPSPAAIKVTLQPLASAPELKSDKTGKTDKTIAELAEEAGKGSDKIPAPANVAPSEEKIKEMPAENEAPKSDESTAGTVEAQNNHDTDNDTGKSPDKEGSTDDSKDAKQTAALEAEAKKLEEINSLVESHEYFLPINAVERHRSKVVAVFGLILILALGALLLDLLLDVGFIRLGGVHSLTHFFSS